MKHALLLSALSIVLLSSCATAFKAGQTPDDVYYSPGVDRPAAEERINKEEEAQYQDYISSLDDRYLRMKVANRYRWGTIDNFDYWNDSRYDFNTYYNPYAYNNYGYYNSVNPYAWNPGWNLRVGYGNSGIYPGYNNWGWSSPVYTVVHYSIPSYGSTSGSNISAYRNKTYSNTNYGYKDAKTGLFIPSASNSGFGNLLKRVFSNGTSTQPATTYDRPVRTFTPSTTTPAPATSSSAGGSSGGYGSTGSSTGSGRSGRGN